jgi:nitrogen regulatory protein P-II 1
MKLVIIILNKIELLEDLLEAFLEIGVSGATVLDSVGMGHVISEHIPIFAGLQDAFAGSSPGNKTILAVVEDEMVDKVAEVVNDICSNFNEPGSGLMITVPVDKIFGYTHGND